ncbi:MAG: Lrp/AsnC family transcriptional regulator [Planctomycetes bacterium]|nr:Lrp/AsnC family transcriptional regulator [Planctomycetota bacterium]MBM4079131.1 Lrp/AsnC family transcriptional regulator [Planctomycetota bacterium]MBM4083595.1 Lrp/AsnC family transcriptional regulator [Planctomycetota bacterium]
MTDATDLRILKRLQHGLPLTSTPYADVARELGLRESAVRARLGRMLKAGAIRRISASIAHRKVGITANAMCAWRVPEERVEAVGAIMASFPQVTHCYQRPTRPRWPYNLFTMIHGYRDAECEAVIRQIRRATGVKDFVVLYSQKEFKKESIRL